MKPEESLLDIELMTFFLEQDKRSFNTEFKDGYQPNRYIEEFMLNMGFLDDKGKYFPTTALTFDDVNLADLVSDTMPHSINPQSFFSRNVPVNIPISSAAMDTVTEGNMGIGMALNGGIGVIHKGMSPEHQAKEVDKVKHFLHGMIMTPIGFEQETPVYAFFEKVDKKGYKFTSFPVFDAINKVVGMVTGTHSKCRSKYRDPNLKLRDIMKKNPHVLEEGSVEESRRLRAAYDMMLDLEIGSLPVVDKDGILKGMYVWNDVQRIVEGRSRFYNTDSQGRLRCAAAISPNIRDEEELKRIDLLVEKGIDALVIDTSHANSMAALETLRYIKKKHPGVDVVVGNIAYADLLEEFIEAGVDGVKIGIGPGSICTTRMVSGAGMPQISAGYGAVYAAKGRTPIIIDGGMRVSGDISKAIAIGAHCVMLGGGLAGTDASPGKIVPLPEGDFVAYRGMASEQALLDNDKRGAKQKASRQRYFMKDEDQKESGVIAQGVEGLVPYKGPLSDVLYQFVEGLRIGMAHSGAESISEFHKRARMFQVLYAGQEEGRVHDVSQMGARRG